MPVGDSRLQSSGGGKSSLPAEIPEQLEEYRRELELGDRDFSLDAAVWFYAGESARAAGRVDEAVACFKKVIEVAPEESWPYWELADLYADQSAPPAAVMVLSALGERLMGQQRWPEAIAAWKRASELAPDDVDVLEALREAYVRIGRVSEANQIQSSLQAQRPAAQRGQDGGVAAADRKPDARPAAPEPKPNVRPAPAEVPQDVWPTHGEGTQDVWPTPVEGTQDVWPTPVEGTQNVWPAPVEGTQDVWPTPVEGTQDGWPASVDLTKDGLQSPVETIDAWPPAPAGIQDAWPTPSEDLPAPPGARNSASPAAGTQAPAGPTSTGTRAPSGSAASGTQAPAGPTGTGTRAPSGSAASGTQASAGPATSGARGSAGSAAKAPATPSAPPKKPIDGDGAGTGPSAQPDARPGETMKGKTAREPLLRKILLAHGWVTEDQVKQAVDIQRRSNGRLGRILVEMEAVSENQLAQGLAELWGLEYTDLTESSIDPMVARSIPAYLARRHGAVAVTRKNNKLIVAMSDPSNVVAIDDIRLLTGMDVDVIIASAATIARSQALVYGGGGDIGEMFKGNEPEIAEDRQEEANLESLRTGAEEAPIIRAVNQILGQAIQSGASDIHIEPHRLDVKVRLRIDGVLQDIMSPPKSVQAPLVSRIKILADMDIAERRLPQDGHIHVRAEGKEYDLRISTLPTVLGEKVVIRILDQSSTKTELHEIGFTSDILSVWEGLITKPYGMILVTGPTGSGKTTTLYTSLARINTPERNIVSVENPVEYQVPRVNQVQVNPKIGLTFANGLRTILRQDPDVVLIGEIRDKETAEIAVQASMTGHLVLSTVHTNDAPGAVTRLTDIGIEPFLITSSLIGILAQRLVRVICSKCKESYTAPADALRRLEIEGDGSDVQLFRGRGCDHCRQTGYKGRVGVFELMVMTDRLREIVVKDGSTEELRRAALEQGMRTLKQDAIKKVLEGITSFEEMLRVVFVSETAEQ